MNVLIGRLHIGGRNVKNSWSQLSKHLGKKIVPIEQTKAFIEVRDQQEYGVLKNKLNMYNKQYQTDFFVD